MKQPHIRNFSIIAHIDHGKSTLADRIMEYTGATDSRTFHNQMLDDMDLEQERGITIKASAVRIIYKPKKGGEYMLNLIDTPGHIDFTYEVSKSLRACEGALLLVDAGQGVEAQTVANLYLAVEHNLEIVPVINKIDLSTAEPDKVKTEIHNILGVAEKDILLASAKMGIGIEEILDRIVEKIPPPEGDPAKPLQALIFDSNFDIYQGVIVYVRMFNGVLRKGMKIKMMGSGKRFEILEVGFLAPKPVQCQTLSSGEVGYITCNIRSAKEVENGDTITDAENPTDAALPGYKKIRPLVFAGIYPVNSKDFEALKDALEKLRLSDASFVFEVESSASVGFGFRCGFLGLLHLEIVQERLEREYDQSLIITAPTVRYEVVLHDGTSIFIDNPELYPDPTLIQTTREPFIKAAIIIPDKYMGAVMTLCMERRGISSTYHYLAGGRMEMVFELPLGEVMYDFYDKLKTVTQGYGSFDYELLDYRDSSLVRLDILVNNERVDALSKLAHTDKAVDRARHACKKLAEEIPRQMFKIPIQGAISGKIISRETISALRKDVTAKCYGGDISRKRKLLEKQKKGKKRMKTIGKVAIPQSAFLAVLKSDQT